MVSPASLSFALPHGGRDRALCGFTEAAGQQTGYRGRLEKSGLFHQIKGIAKTIEKARWH